jgi:hypothetical protein
VLPGATVLRVPPDVAALPGLDLARRVHLLHRRLYPDGAPGTAER